MEPNAFKVRTALRRQRVTIMDVADSLGMTKSTVSRALNGYPDISESTRLKVRDAAERLGYRPLSNAQAIRTGRVRSIGLIIQVSEYDRHRPFLADFLDGVSEAASAADWTMTVATAASDTDTFRLLCKLADERKVDGFILPRTLVDDPRVHLLREADVPFVLYGRTGDDHGCAWFDINSEAAMAEAVALLAELGHQRIGFIPAGDRYMYARLRSEGYRAGLKAAKLPFAAELVAPPALNRQEGANSARLILNQDQPPTAILCAVDRAAIGVYDAAKELGLRIGRDLSLISYDDIPEAELLTPPLTTYAVDTRRAGARLTDLLIRRIKGEAPEKLRELEPARFVARESHGPGPSAGPAKELNETVSKSGGKA